MRYLFNFEIDAIDGDPVNERNWLRPEVWILGKGGFERSELSSHTYRKEQKFEGAGQIIECLIDGMILPSRVLKC